MPPRPLPPWLPASTLRPWSSSDRRTVGRYRIFDVERSTVHDGGGATRGEVFTFACADWCNVVAVTDDDRLVLLYQYRFGTERLSLEIPGGVIDPGESPLDAARRELLEETGYAPREIVALGGAHPNPALQGNVCHTFLALGCRPVAALAPDPLEELEVVLVPSDRVHDLIDEGHVTHALVVVALERYARSRTRG